MALIIVDGLTVIGRVVRPYGRRRLHHLCRCRCRSEMTPRGPALSAALRRGPGIPVTRRWPGQGVGGLVLVAWCRAAGCHLNWSFTLGHHRLSAPTGCGAWWLVRSGGARCRVRPSAPGSCWGRSRAGRANPRLGPPGGGGVGLPARRGRAGCRGWPQVAAMSASNSARSAPHGTQWRLTVQDRLSTVQIRG